MSTPSPARWPARPSTAQVVIRPMRRRDLRAVAAIEADRNGDPWSRRLFAGELELDPATRHWLVAAWRTTVVGFAGVMYAAGEGHVMNLAVARPWSGRGIGLRLCLAQLDEARRRGIGALTLEVRAANAPAIALYGKLGFTSAGVRPGYYPDGEDAQIMWLHELQSPEVAARLAALTAAASPVPASGRTSGGADPAAPATAADPDPASSAPDPADPAATGATAPRPPGPEDRAGR